MLIRFIAWAALTALFSAICGGVVYAAGTAIASAQELRYCGPMCWTDLNRGFAASFWVGLTLVEAVACFAYIVMGDD